MKFPVYEEIPSERTIISTFGGYNRKKRINEAEFSDMENMASDDFPVLSTRGKRGRLRHITKPNGLFAHTKLCWVDGTAFYYSGQLVEGLTLEDSPKQLVGMGANILIWPDKKYYNTYDGTFGNLGAIFELASDASVSYAVSDYEGTDFDYTVSTMPPAAPTLQDSSGLAISNGKGTYWIDISTTPYALMRYAEYWMDTSATPIPIKHYLADTDEWEAVSATSSESAPGSPQAGAYWYKPSTKRLYLYKSSKWAFCYAHDSTEQTLWSPVSATVADAIYAPYYETSSDVPSWWLDTNQAPAVLKTRGSYNPKTDPAPGWTVREYVTSDTAPATPTEGMVWHFPGGDFDTTWREYVIVPLPSPHGTWNTIVNLVAQAMDPSPLPSGSLWVDTSETLPVLRIYTYTQISPWSELTAVVADRAPAAPADRQYWLDISVTPNVLKRYNAADSVWNSLAYSYVKISATGIGAAFSQFDGVTISGCNQEALNGEFLIQNKGNDFIVVSASIGRASSQTGGLKIERKIPDLDFLCVSNNRVWGCAEDGHELIASMLGDAKNWNSFAGVSSDSYRVNVGSHGKFTGCVAHGDYVLFHKEDIIHRVYGTLVENISVTEILCPGVQAGSGKSLCVINETLFFKARNDVCVHATSLPSSISDALTGRYKNAVAGAFGRKYYVSMQEGDAWHLLVYDADRGLWHREDGAHVLYFAPLNGELYFISGNALYSVGGSINEDYADENAALEDDFEWQAMTGDIGLDTPDFKYVSKIQIHLSMETGARVAVAVQYDRETTWDTKVRIPPTTRRSHVIPIIPRRCETMRIRISGAGACSIYSLTKTIEQGSEI